MKRTQHLLTEISTVVIAKDAGDGKPAFVGDDASLGGFLAKTKMLGIPLSNTHKLSGGILPLNEQDIAALKGCPLFEITEYETLASARGVFNVMNMQTAMPKKK